MGNCGAKEATIRDGASSNAAIGTGVDKTFLNKTTEFQFLCGMSMEDQMVS